MKFGEYLTEQIENMNLALILFRNCQPYLKEMRKIKADHFFYRGTNKILGSNGFSIITPRKDRFPKDMPEEIHNYIDDYFYDEFGWRPRREGVFTSYKQTDAMNYGRPCLFFPIDKYDYVFSPEVGDLFGDIDDDGDIKAAFDEDSIDDWYWEDDWDREYGPYSNGGSWYYEGDNTGESDKDSAAEVAAEANDIDFDEFDEGDLYWVPEVTLEDFIEEKKEEAISRGKEQLDEKLGTYIQSKNLDKALQRSGKGWDIPEVMWKCKKYYIVSENLEDYLIDQLLKTSNKDFKYTYDRLGKQRQLPFKWSKKR